MLKDIVIADWRNAWKFISVQIAALMVVVGTVMNFMPAIQALVPPDTYGAIVGVLGAVIAVGRVLKQPIFGAATVAETPTLYDESSSEP